MTSKFKVIISKKQTLAHYKRMTEEFRNLQIFCRKALLALYEIDQTHEIFDNIHPDLKQMLHTQYITKERRCGSKTLEEKNI